MAVAQALEVVSDHRGRAEAKMMAVVIWTFACPKGDYASYISGTGGALRDIGFMKVGYTPLVADDLAGLDACSFVVGHQVQKVKDSTAKKKKSVGSLAPVMMANQLLRQKLPVIWLAQGHIHHCRHQHVI